MKSVRLLSKIASHLPLLLFFCPQNAIKHVPVFTFKFVKGIMFLKWGGHNEVRGTSKEGKGKGYFLHSKTSDIQI